MPWLRIYKVENMSFHAILKNKILAKISEWLEFDVFAYGYTVRSFLP